jgi:adenosylcobinamide-GDP ribazoletransferase
MAANKNSQTVLGGCVEMLDTLLLTFTFLTILPFGALIRRSDRPPGHIFGYFPLVGLVIGALVSLTATIQGLPHTVITFLTLAVWVALTGGLHLDGLADSCDGLLATVSPERRLEIMKDPRAGSWAVIGIVLLLLGKWTAITALPPTALILPPVIGRWGMVLAVAWFPSARTSGLASGFRDGFGRTQIVLATAITLGIALGISLFAWHSISGMLLLLIAPLTVWSVGGWAARRLGGGLTGDSYGALCEIIELLCLIALTLRMG